MIMRRLSTSIRKQDWFTVLIEMLIVVLGVYLGIQLGNWNEANRNNARLIGALERLEGEVRTNIDIANDLVAIIEEEQDERVVALEVLQFCTADEAQMDALNIAITSTIRDYAPSFIDNSFSELLGRDELLDLLSSEFRQVMGGYRGQLTEDQDQFNTNFNLMWMDHLIRSPMVGVDFEGEEGSPRLVLATGIEEACADPRFQVQLLTTVSFIMGLRLRAERFVEESEAFLASIQSERGAL
ncbi:hypothetical protein [Ponticaulis koreensis]|uniref:hypothetical protein n=1 Tax=Ponticaulis koreensis TaxID=1123045 RepID=UPI0003B4FFA7|nr:hypothetical protein [Ponticaulis koreensis]